MKCVRVDDDLLFSAVQHFNIPSYKSSPRSISSSIGATHASDGNVLVHINILEKFTDRQTDGQTNGRADDGQQVIKN